MAGETVVTVIGNLTSDPELRFTPAGVAVANFTIASTPRTYNRNSGQWEDGEALFLRASIWREYAENVAETLKKGLTMMSIAAEWQFVVTGIVLLLAVVIDNLRRIRENAA